MPGGEYGSTTTAGYSSSGSGTFNPSSISGFAARYDFSVVSSLTVVSNDIRGVNDLSGNGFHLTQQGSGIAAGVVLNTTTVNGLVAATFSGTISLGLSSRGVSTVSVTAGNTGTWFAVIKGSTTSSNERVLSLTTAVATDDHAGTDRIVAILRSATQAKFGGYYNGTMRSDVAVTNGTQHVVTTMRNGDSHTSWCDGVVGSTVTGLGTANFAIAQVDIGAYFNIADWGDPFTGQICEVIWYNAALSAGNRQAVEAYLKTKWGTP